MYFSTEAITGFRCTAADGDLGKILGFGFDTEKWRVRCLFVRLGWLPGHVVLVDPESVRMVDGAKRRVHLDLTVDELRRHPATRRNWSTVGAAGRQNGSAGARQLRNTSEITGLRAVATDGDAGKISDLVVDTNSWRIRELIVRDGWLFRSHRAVPPQWVETIDWDARRLTFEVTRGAIQSSPSYDVEAPVNTTRETRVVDYAARTHLSRREEMAV